MRACANSRAASTARGELEGASGRPVELGDQACSHVDVGLGEQGDGIGGREWSWNGPSFIYPLKRVQYFNIAKRCMPLQPIDVYIRTHHTHSVPNLSLTRESIRYYIHLYIPRERAEMPDRGHTFSIAQTDGVAHLLTLPASSDFAFYIPPHYF